VLLQESVPQTRPQGRLGLGHGFVPGALTAQPKQQLVGTRLRRIPAVSVVEQEYLAAPLCVNKTYRYNAASLSDDLPARRPFVTFLLRKPSNSSNKPSIRALYDTGAAVSLLTQDDFALIKKYGIVLGEIEGKCKVQNASQQPMTIFGTWHMPNASNEDRVLPRGTLVGKAQDLNEWLPLDAASATEITKPGVPMRPHTSAEREQIISRIKKSVNRTVPYQYRDDYARMLIAREHFFSADTNNIGSTDLLEHQIDLKTNDPIYCPQFRLHAEHLKHIQENVAGWLQCGIIERSKSNYNSPIFCVPKKDGQGIRTVLDYQMLNSRSLLSLYSVRTIDECIEFIGRANSKVFSAADVSNAFWTLSTRASNYPNTAFTIPGTGQFQWCRMAQGLAGSLGYFSRLMDLIMAGAENVLTYIDDLLVHSKNHSDHLIHLANALDRWGRLTYALTSQSASLRHRRLSILATPSRPPASSRARTSLTPCAWL
jgi:hypothetical protein